jgi:hypothetical protein
VNVEYYNRCIGYIIDNSMSYKMSKSTLQWLTSDFLYAGNSIQLAARMAQDLTSLSLDTDISSLAYQNEHAINWAQPQECSACCVYDLLADDVTRQSAAPSHGHKGAMGTLYASQLSLLKKEQTMKGDQTLTYDLGSSVYSNTEIANSISVSAQAAQALALEQSASSTECEAKGIVGDKFSFVIETAGNEDYAFVVEQELAYWQWFEVLVSVFVSDDTAWSSNALSTVEDFCGTLRRRRKGTLTKTVFEYDTVQAEVAIAERCFRFHTPHQDISTKLGRGDVARLLFSHAFNKPDSIALRVRVRGGFLPDVGAQSCMYALLNFPYMTAFITANTEEGVMCQVLAGAYSFETSVSSGPFAQWDRTGCFFVNEQFGTFNGLQLRILGASDRYVLAEGEALPQCLSTIPAKGREAVSVRTCKHRVRALVHTLTLPPDHPAGKKGVYCNAYLVDAEGRTHNDVRPALNALVQY